MPNSITIQQAIQLVLDHKDLSQDEMHHVMQIIMTGEATPSQIGGFLIGLRMKGESVNEITAAAKVMRELSTKVDIKGENLVDTCGTGGDASGSFNISTVSAIVAAAAGAQVAKHGNRSVSSKSGSADVLEQSGVNLNLTPDQVARCINDVGVGFMFAPLHHSAMKHAIGPRKEMAVRTIFNLLGPLTNPASAPNQVLGVFDKQWVEPLAQVLKSLGSNHVMVVNAEDGLDEISIGANTTVAELKNGEVKTYTLNPEDYGFTKSALSSLKAEDSQASLAIIKGVLDNQASAAKDIVVLNSGAAIYVSGLVADYQAGINKAEEVIANGQAKTTWDNLVSTTQKFK